MANEFNKGVSTESVQAGRLVAHGKIASLAAGFDLAGTPFSIMVIPVANVTAGVISVPTDLGIIVSCKLIQDNSASDMPVMFAEWTEGMIMSIDIDAIELDDYDVYWSTGN
jgi:hypothetical protein